MTFAHARASPSKVTYLLPEMLYTCLLALGLPRTLMKAVAKSCCKTKHKIQKMASKTSNPIAIHRMSMHRP